jgi:hypothetical protein
MDSINSVGVESAPKEDLLSYLELLSFSTKTTVTQVTITTTTTTAVQKTDEEIAAEKAATDAKNKEINSNKMAIFDVLLTANVSPA